MKNIVIILLMAFLFVKCAENKKTPTVLIRDGFYEVVKPGDENTLSDALTPGQVIIPFDPLLNPGEFSKVVIDTNEYVPMELDELPSIEQQNPTQKLLSMSLAPGAALKLKTFTENRIMKQAVVVIGAKAITMNKIREAITGGKMQITGCDDNACEVLYLKMKAHVIKQE